MTSSEDALIFSLKAELKTERVLKEQAVELLRNRYGDYQLWGRTRLSPQGSRKYE